MTQNALVLDYGHWCLFEVWCLGFGALINMGHIITNLLQCNA
jgi:hypothetical protein